MDEKHRLRERLRTARKSHVQALPESTLGLLFMRPPASVLDLLPEGATIGLYHASRFEAPAQRWAQWLHERGRKTALPWFADRNSAMQFRLWENPFDDLALVADPWNAKQPPDDAPAVTPDVLVVPLLGFTAECARIGQGKGHFDRWLAAHPATQTVGLAWDCQLVETLPLEPHDRPLDAVVTPTRFYERRGNAQ